MGKNHKVVTKRRRRQTYLKRIKAVAAEKSLIAKPRRAAKKAAAPAVEAAPAA